MEKKVNLDLFKRCEHEECGNHDTTLGKEYFIHNPYDAKGYDIPITTHLQQANPWAGESVDIIKNNNSIQLRFINPNPEIYEDMDVIEHHSPMGIYIDTNYTEKMLYNAMTTCEQKAYDSLPDIFTAYRGYAIKQEEELREDLLISAKSWTLDREVAEHFTKFHSRFKKNPKKYIISGIIYKVDVAFVILDREEAEVKLYADCINDIEDIEEIK